MRTARTMTMATSASVAIPAPMRDAIPGARRRAGLPADASTGVPHSLQNRAPAANGALQRLHAPGPSGVPHAEQNLPAAAAPHEGHWPNGALDALMCVM
jgi:hypothetical protein